jgi:hypothetical protein
MHMPKRGLKLLAIIAVCAVTPAAATTFNPDNQTDLSGCPYERAELFAAGYVVESPTVGDPAEGSLFDLARRSSLFTP